MANHIKAFLIGVSGWVLWVMPSALPAVELPNEVVSLLASDQFSVREKAQKDLLAWSRENRAVAIAGLFRQSKQADDPEVRQRCLAVLQELAADDYMKSGEGYVGILMQDERADIPGDAKPRSVIRVGQVVEGSAADLAGLKQNDLIAGMDDDVWRDAPASFSFTEKVRKLKPGTKVKLEIVRDGKLQDIEVKLGKRPAAADHPFINPDMDLEQFEKKARNEFFRQWMNQHQVKSPVEKP